MFTFNQPEDESSLSSLPFFLFFLFFCPLCMHAESGLTRTYLHPVESKTQLHAVNVFIDILEKHLMLCTVSTQKTLDFSLGYQNRHNMHDIKVVVDSLSRGM